MEKEEKRKKKKENGVKKNKQDNNRRQRRRQTQKRTLKECRESDVEYLNQQTGFVIKKVESAFFVSI